MPKKLPASVIQYYKLALSSSNELHDFYIGLLGSNDIEPVVKDCPVKKGRLDKLKLLLPKAFIEKLESKSPGYLSQFMHCDNNAHTIHEYFHQLVQYNADALLNEMDILARQLLYDEQTEKFDQSALKRLIFQDFCSVKDCLKNTTTKMNPYRRRLEFCFELDPAMALSRMVLFLALGPYGSQDLNYLFPGNDALTQTGNPAQVQNDPKTQKAYADYLYDEGNFKDAFAIYEAVSKQMQDGHVLCRLGKMYETGNGCKKDFAAAFQYYKKSADRNNADGYYGLYKCYLNGIGQTADAAQAAACLEKAYENGSRLAARDIGIAYYAGNVSMGYAQNTELAKKYFMVGADGDSYDDVALTCLYMSGICYEKSGAGADAMMTAKNYYTKAAVHGHYSAQERLLDMGWLENGSENLTSDTETAVRVSGCRFSYFNCDSRESMSLPESVGSEHYDVCYGSVTEFVDARLGGESLIHLAEQGADARFLFYFFHSSEAKNRNDVCELLEYLKNLVQKYPELAEFLAESVKIFLRSTDTLTTTLIDSMISSMRTCYFPVRICDPYKDASEWLYANLPLFLPNIKDARKNRINVTILGDGPCVPWLIRNAISVCHTELPFTLSVLTSDETRLKRELRKECAGIFTYRRLIKAKLNFFELEPDDPEIGDMFAADYKTEDPSLDALANELRKTDYFIIAGDDSTKNLELSMQLRQWCLKNDPSFSRFPIIAAYCPDSRLSWQSQKFTAGNAPIGYQWYNNYDIRCFGAFTELYSAFNLTEGLLERRALQTHLSYYGDLSDKKTRYNALSSYYSRHYNRDSSRCSAINLIYRAFAVGIHLDDGISYGIAQNERLMADAYEDWLNGASVIAAAGSVGGSAGASSSARRTERDKLLLAARLEHERWCNYMLTRGWESAAIDQMAVYMQRGNPGHQFYLAKLHPYICSWDELGDDSDGVQYYLNQTLKNLNPDAKPKRLKEMNIDNVRASAKLFRL